MLIQNYISRQKKNQFWGNNRWKVIKTSFALIGKFTIKKFEFYLRTLFLENFSYFFVFLSHLQTNQFSDQVSVNANLIDSLMNPNERKKCF